ncbi:MAG: NAD(P)H-dependent glycerol-3-phosphate dehydrogenase, partial [Bacteroidales bacterium]
DICSAIKGIIPETNQVVGTFLQEVMQVDLNRLSVISGPSHAEEIALGRLTYLTSASQNEGMARRMASYFDCSYVRTRLSEDVFGIEYAAVIKNVYALAVGISKGLGYGDNFSAVLVSNALEEMKVFLERVYPIDRNLSTSVYLGDLLVTSYSQFSRNRTFGNMIGQGYSVKSTILEMKMVAEGYYASLSVHKIKEEMHINMPILEAVYDILYNHQSPSQVFSILETKFE